VIVRQFEVVDGMLGLLTAPAFEVSTHVSPVHALKRCSPKDGFYSWIGKTLEVNCSG